MYVCTVCMVWYVWYSMYVCIGYECMYDCIVYVYMYGMYVCIYGMYVCMYVCIGHSGRRFQHLHLPRWDCGTGTSSIVYHIHHTYITYKYNINT